MSDESREEYKLVQAKLEEMKPLYDRMDEDEKLYLLDPFTMRKLDGSGDEKDVANVTLPEPLDYLKKAIAIVSSYQKQIIVESNDLTDKETTKIEYFSTDFRRAVNEWLPSRDIPSLEAFVNEQACVRGGIPARVCIRLNKEGNIIPDIVPVDRRWFIYNTDEAGIAWAAPITRRSKASIVKDYGEVMGLKPTGNEVIDFWDKEKEVVFVEKKIVKEQENTYGYVPFVQSICPIGSLLWTDDALSHKGESIFWPNRGIWKEKNEIATIVKTLSRKALKGGLELQRNINSTDRGKKPEQSPYQEDVVIETEIGGGFRQLPVSDIKNATRLLLSIIQESQQKGELSPYDYGMLRWPVSGVVLMQLLSGRNDILAPILSMIASFDQSLLRMVINQVIQLNQEIKVGRLGNYSTYSPSDFDGEYSIEYTLSLLSKEQIAADMSLANSMWGRLPDDYIFREIIKVQNPDGLLEQLRSQQAERLDDLVFLYRRARALVDKDKPTEPDKIESKLLTARGQTIWAQRQTLGTLSPIEGKKQPNPTPTESLPLFAKGGGQGRLPEQEAESEQD